jgi:hypothetical protein
VPHLQEVAEHVDLLVVVRARDLVVDLLEQDDVGVVVHDGVADPVGGVPPIDAADALVDVVGEDADLHIVTVTSA